VEFGIQGTQVEESKNIFRGYIKSQIILYFYKKGSFLKIPSKSKEQNHFIYVSSKFHYVPSVGFADRSIRGSLQMGIPTFRCRHRV
jgi:hypothetical protein